MRNLLCILIVASLGSLFELMYAHLTVYAENVDRYWSVLTGDKQIPPNSRLCWFHWSEIPGGYEKTTYSTSMWRILKTLLEFTSIMVTRIKMEL